MWWTHVRVRRVENVLELRKLQLLVVVYVVSMKVLLRLGLVFQVLLDLRLHLFKDQEVLSS